MSIERESEICGCSSSGRAPPCQGGGSEFEPRQPLHFLKNHISACGCSSSGRAPPCQGGGSEFEPRQPLQRKGTELIGAFVFMRSALAASTFVQSEVGAPVKAQLLRGVIASSSLVSRSKKQSIDLGRCFCFIRRDNCCRRQEDAVPTAGGECRRLAAETRGDRTPNMVSCPLLSPLTFL